MDTKNYLKGMVLTALLFITAAATAQPRGLAEMRSGIETKNHYYNTSWVCTGDTIAVDSTNPTDILYKVDGFWIMCEEMTQDYWEWYMHSNPSTIKGELLPVNNVSREAVDSLCRAIYATLRQEWRIPTLEEWRFAYNGGIFSEGYRYSGSDNILFVGWTAHNSTGKLHYGGKLVPNELGIYDMAGNVAEMVTSGDSTLFAGRSFRTHVKKAKSRFTTNADNVAPECRGLRLVWHEPLWFNKYLERVFK